MESGEVGHSQKRKRNWEGIEDFKKPKLEENDKPQSCEDTKTGQCDNFEEILQLVVDYFDFKCLKIIRSVCKSWNTEICRALHSRSYIHLQEKQCKEFLKLMSSGQNLSLPSPFSALDVEGHTLVDDDLKFLINSEETQVIKLKLTEPGSYKENFPGNFHDILTSQATNLTHLKLEGINFRIKKTQVEKAYTGSPGSVNSTPTSRSFVYYKKEIEYHKEWIRSSYFQRSETSTLLKQLSALDYFGFSNLGVNEQEGQVSEDDNNITNIIGFLVEIINSATNLKTLHFSRIDVNILEHILSCSKLSSITDIRAECITDDHLSAISTLELPNLKHLTLQQEDKLLEKKPFPLNRSIAGDIELFSTVEIFCASIIKLHLKWNWHAFDFTIRCPHLKSLLLESFHCPLDSLDCITSDLLPELEHLAVDRYYPYRCSEFVPDPHMGVRSISLDVSSRGLDHLEPLMSGLSLSFPSVKSLNIKLGTEASCIAKTIECVTVSYPKLQVLILQSNKVLENSLACLGLMSEKLKSEEQMSSITGELSILKLSALTTLVLNSSILVTDFMVEVGISKIPGLTNFEFFWPENSLSTEVIFNLLQHLRLIRVCNCCVSDIRKIVLLLFVTMKSLRCGCKNRRNFSSPFGSLVH